MEKILTSGKYFVDEYGRQRIFNGMNLCDKGTANVDCSKRTYALDFDESTISKLKKSGFNLIRLGLTWDAVEPLPGKYDEDYLDRLEKVTDLCDKYGIYYYLDMHQDLYGGAVDSPGDGAPGWACITDGHKFFKPKFVWAEGYFYGKAVHRSFDHFWKNDKVYGKPLQEYYCDMWVHIAERFKDKPGLFGFDVMNEPFPGTPGGKVFLKLILSAVKHGCFDGRVNRAELIRDALKPETRHKVLDQFADPGLFHKLVCEAGEKEIRKFDTSSYYPFLCRVASAIRSVTDNGIIIMENCYYSNLGIPCSTPAVTVNGKQEEKLCFAPHGYDLTVDTPDYKYASNSRTGSIFDEHKRTQDRLGIPVIVGEWGGSGGNEGTEWLGHINFLLDKFDANQWGQTYWAYTKGIFDSVIMLSLLKTSPVAVTGRIESYGYDRENNVFSLTYNQEDKYKAPTEIYLHKTPAKIESSGKYEIKPIADTEAATLLLKTKPGKNFIKIYY